MASRTNKMGILKKKRQLQKQRNLLNKTKKEEIIWKKQFTNPKWNTYDRFFRSGKWINDKTWQREDPDWYRIRRLPNSSEIEWIYNPLGWWYRKWIRKMKKSIN
jgi:uncharacterized protein RhaS with RHS repeats